MTTTTKATQYVRLPNEKICKLDEHGYINVEIDLELNDFIDNDFEGLLDVMSEEATGTDLLCSISYVVKSAEGTSLRVVVSGSIEALKDNDKIEYISLEDLPEREFEIDVTRVGYGTRTITVSAKTEEEAIMMADDDAGNHLYSEHASNYEFSARETPSMKGNMRP